MIRVLQVVNDMNRAGLETMLMNYYRHIDRTQIQFDFLTHRPYKGDYDDEILSLGGQIYHAPRLYPQNLPTYFRYMKAFFQEHPEYKIIHSHIDAMSYLPLLAAKRAGVPVRIAHSHSTSIDKDFKILLKQIYRKLLPSTANYYFACGDAAGKFLFGNRPFTKIPNAIDAMHFKFDAALRKEKRQELGIDKKLVIGHVGRFSYPKNHAFLIDTFHEIAKKEDSAVLVLVGTGENEEAIRKQVERYDLVEKIYFLGSRADVNELYQAMDIFVMPSRFEGVPMVGVEAQFAGLPCIFSDKVPSEIMFHDNCKFLSLESSPSVWAMAILDAAKHGRYSGPVTPGDEWYDIWSAHTELEKQYITTMR